MLPSGSFTQPVQLEGSKATYAAGINITSFAATATDVFQIIGSSTKVIKVCRLQITADAAAAAGFDFYVYKRTVANTGGTVSAVTGISYDSQDPAATATVQTYSVNASPLGAGAVIRCDASALPAAATTGYPFNPVVFTFGTQNGKMPTLRGVAESLTVNLAGQAIPTGLSVYIDIEWTEE